MFIKTFVTDKPEPSNDLDKVNKPQICDTLVSCINTLTTSMVTVSNGDSSVTMETDVTAMSPIQPENQGWFNVWICNWIVTFGTVSYGWSPEVAPLLCVCVQKDLSFVIMLKIWLCSENGIIFNPFTTKGDLSRPNAMDGRVHSVLKGLKSEFKTEVVNLFAYKISWLKYYIHYI